MSRKIIQITFSILLLAGMVLGFALKDGVLAQENPTAKIEAGLAEKLVAGPADFFVVMADQADLSLANLLQTKAEKGQYVFDTLVATANQTQANLRSYLDSQGVDYKSYYIVNTILVKQGTIDLANAIAARGDVSAIQDNHSYQLEEPMIDPAALNVPEAVEPNISFVEADQVWALGVTGEGSVVASNDTGLYWSHPALIRQYRGCQNPPDCTVVDHNFNWWDATGTYPTVPDDGHGHGTHTSGTMVGDDGGANQIGMAPGARLVACKNMDNGGYGQDQWFLDCFEWDLAPWDLSGSNPTPGLAPDAINNSWGYGGGGQNQFRTAVDNLMAAGIIVEVSAGNEGSGCYSLRSPADYAEVFTTGSINHAGGVLPGTITGFSSRGPSNLDDGFFPDFMAPGENIRSSVPGGGYEGGWSGTSMAGPHVTGLIGLIWSANPALRGMVDTTYEIIQQTVVPLTGQNGSNCGGDYTVGPNNDWGYGTIDALSAVQLAITMGGAGHLDGTVADAATGDPIEGATVHALHEGGFARDAQTDPTGYYTMTVAAGLFDVTASHPMYESVTVSSVEVITDEVTTLPFELTPRGELTGVVTDYDNGFGIVGATVAADDGTTATTDDNGEYVMYLDEGTHDVTASMQNYADQTETVDMVSGETTVQDFALQAAVAFLPSPVHVTVDMESTYSMDASILNRQGFDYPFEFQEKDEGYTPALNQLITLDVKGTNLEPDTNTAIAAGFKQRADGSVTLNRINRVNQANVLLVAADYDGDYGSPIQAMLQAYGDLGAIDYFDARYATPTLGQLQAYDTVVVWSNFVFSDPTGMGNVLADFVDAGGKVIDMMFGIDPSWGYQGRFRTQGYTAMTGSGTSYVSSCLGTFDPSNPIMDGVSNVCDVYREYGTALTAGSSEVARWQDNELFVAVKDDSSVVTINGYVGYAYQWTGQMADVLHNAINYLAVPPDVPWLGEDPAAGTVPAESDLPVTVYFSATQAVGINQPGDYMATLKLNGSPKVEVPVVMTVPAPETWGKVQGVVTDFCTNEPIEEAMVSIPDGVPITQTFTDEAGIYWAWLEAGNYDVTFTADGFVDFPTTLEITPGEVTLLDAALKPAFGCLTADPTSMEVTLEMGDETTLPLTLGNVGGADLSFDIRETDKGFTPAVHIPRFTGELPEDSRPVSTGAAPQTDALNPAAPAVFPLASVSAYAMDVYPDYNLVDIPDLTTPNTWNVIANEPGSAFFAGDAINGDFSTLYVLDYYLNSLIAIDTATGAQTVIGSSVPLSGETWTGLSGSTDGVMFASSTNIARSTLYTVDLNSGAVTVVGEITNAPAIIDIAINAAGEMYGVDIVNDVLMQIDPATGAGTVVGSLGASANYAQGMDFDEETGILYWAAYTTQGELRIIDTESGASALVGSFPSGAETDAFAVRTFAGGDVPWVSEDPITGTIPSDGSQMVDVTFDASVVNQPGSYKAELKVSVDSPYPGAKIPVTMNITPPPTWGKLDGTVTDICTGEALKDVEVLIDGGVPITQTFTDASGYYYAWIEQGNYDVSYSFPGYISADGSVNVLPGEVTTVDIELVPDRPCIKVSPDMIEAWVLTDTQEYETEGLMIADPGAQDLFFDISEREVLPGSTGTTEVAGAPFVPAGATTDNPIQPVRVNNPNADVLVLSSTDVSQSIQRALNEETIPYDFLNKYGGDIPGTDFSSYTTVILGMDGGSFGVADIQYLRTNVIDAGKRLIFMGGTCILDFATGVNTYLVGNNTGNYCWQISTTPHWTLTDPSHGLAEGLPDSLNFVNSSAPYYQIRVTDDTPEVVGMNGDGWPMYFYKGDYGAGDFIWMINSAYSSYWSDANDYAFFKQTLLNAINYTGVKPDVPWIWEVPVSGTVPAGTVQDIGIYLTSQYTDGTPMPLGTYTATLTITSDDPVAPKPKITVIMHVVKEYLAPVPEFTASTADVGNPTEFLNTSDPGIPPTKAYEWDFGDGITMTVGTKDPVYHTYSTFGTFTVTLTACNVAGCETVVHDVMVLPKVLYLPLMSKN